MSVNPPSPDIPISSGEQIPQPPQRSVRSPYLNHVCTVSIAPEAEKAAVAVTTIAGQDMRQASLTTVRNAQHTYDEHPEDKVRGKDSKAVTGALHDIASQHGGEGASGGVLGTTVGSTISQQPIIEDSQSHTLADVQEAPSDVGEEFFFNEEDLDSANSDMRSAESASKERVQEAVPIAIEGIDTASGIASSLYGPLAELAHEAVHDGKLDASLEKGLQSRMQAIAEDAVSIDKWQVLGLLDSMAVKDHGEENLGSVEREILQKGYTLIHEYRGIYRDPEGHVVVFESNGMRATKGALTKSFLDTLPLERRRLAEEHIASGRVGLISPEELEEHARAGAAIAERLHSEVSSAYQDFKKQLAEEQEKAKQAKDDTKKDEDNAQLRRQSQTRHPPRGTPTLEDASKESQEKTTEKKEEKADQSKKVLKGVKDSKIEDLRSKKKKDQTKHASDQQNQKEAGQRIDIEEQKKKEEPPHAPPKETNTPSA